LVAVLERDRDPLGVERLARGQPQRLDHRGDRPGGTEPLARFAKQRTDLSPLRHYRFLRRR
jgi:hypothetical protein